VRCVYSTAYVIDIGPHVFLTAKYRGVRDAVVAAGLVSPEDVVVPGPVGWDDLALVHTPEYLDKLRLGTLTPAEIAQLELPWSPAVVEGFRLMTGGTLAATDLATDAPVGFHIGGGFHHGFPSHGEGFCVFNDVAVAVARLRREGRIRRAAVIDCDVHHGNGTAFIFAADPDVFTFSMHQQHNYPSWKPPGTLDIGLPDGCGDAEYLRLLEGAMARVLAFGPDLAFYLAGADPYGDDQLGGLGLTKEGLRARDRLVLRGCRAAGVPVVVTLAGGYARRLEDTVGIHVATVEEAAAIE
jgi:acetoin utilization deacetylase AcuC-like enzyme